MLNKLGTEKISKLFIRMVIPSVISQLVVLIYNMVDRMFIGHLPDIGSTALTGVGICMPVTLIISAFAQLTGVGGAPLASMALGKNNKEEAERILGTCCFGLLFISVLLTIAGWIFSDSILLFFGASSNTLGYAREYLTIYLAGTVFVELTIGLTAFITSQGFTNITMISVVAGAVLNVFLDPVLMFGCNMGVKGAAIATVFSQMASAMIAIGFLVKHRDGVRLRLKYVRLDRKRLGESMKLGLSPCIMVITESFVSIAFNRSLLLYGGDLAVGSMTIFSTVMQMVTLPLQGFSQGAQPITSYNLGAGDWKRVSANFKLLFAVSLVYACLLWGVILVFPQKFIALFTSNELLAGYSVEMMRIYFAVVGIMGMQYACQNTFLALGNAKVSIFLALLRKVFLLLPLIFILPHIFPGKVEAVFLAEPFADITAVTVTGILFFKEYGKKLQMKSVEKVPEE